MDGCACLLALGAGQPDHQMEEEGAGESVHECVLRPASSSAVGVGRNRVRGGGRGRLCQCGGRPA